MTLVEEGRVPVVWVHGATKAAQSPLTAPAIAVSVLRAVLVQPEQRVLCELPVVYAAPARDSYARHDPVHSQTR